LMRFTARYWMNAAMQRGAWMGASQAGKSPLPAPAPEAEEEEREREVEAAEDWEAPVDRCGCVGVCVSGSCVWCGSGCGLATITGDDADAV
jgi:hypothetical protein